MALKQAEVEQLKAVLAEELEKLLEELPTKAEQAQQGKALDALTLRVAGLATELPKVAGFGQGATPEQVRAVVDEAVKPLAAGTVEALRKATPKLFNGDFAGRQQEDPGVLSRHYWIVEPGGPPAHVPGGGMVQHAPGTVLDARHHNVDLLLGQGVQLRRLYLAELARHGATE